MSSSSHKHAPELIGQVIGLLRQGLSYNQVGAQCGMSGGSVAGIKYRHAKGEQIGMRQTPRRSWTPEKIAELKQLRQTHRLTDIARHFGLRDAAVANALRRYCPEFVAANGRLQPEPKPPKRFRDVGFRMATETEKRPASHIKEQSAPVGAIKFDDLTSHACRWPYGDPCTPEFRFCGSDDGTLLPSRPYCREHTKMAWVGNR